MHKACNSLPIGDLMRLIGTIVELKRVAFMKGPFFLNEAEGIIIFVDKVFLLRVAEYLVQIKVANLATHECLIFGKRNCSRQILAVELEHGHVALPVDEVNLELYDLR